MKSLRINLTAILLLFVLSLSSTLFGATLEVTKPDASSVWSHTQTKTITWTYDGNDTPFKVELIKDDLSFSDEIAEVTVGTFSVDYTVPDSLVAGTDYKIKVTSLYFADFDESDLFEINAGGTPPDAPVLSSPADTAADITDLTPEFTWLEANGADKYLIKVDDVDDTFNSLVIDDSTSSVDLTFTPATNLELDKTYYWKITAKNADGSTDSDVWEFTTILGQTVLAAPADSSTTTELMPTFTWGAVENATAYTIEINTDDTFAADLIKETVTDPTFTVAADLDFNTYYWRVTATADAGAVSSVVSDVFEFTVEKFITVTAPNGLEMWRQLTDETITWDCNIADPVKIELDSAGTICREIVASTPNTGTYTWSIPVEVQVFNNYKIVITSTVDATTDISDAAFEITGAPYVEVTSPVAADLWMAGTTPVITWNDNLDNQDVVKITLSSAALSYSEELPITSVSSFYHDSEGSISNTYDFWEIPTTVESGTDYIVRVERETDPGSVITTESGEFQIFGMPALTLPADGTISPVLQPEFTWTAVGNAAEYEIQIDVVNTFDSGALFVDSVATTTYNVAADMDEGTYFWRVRALQAAVQGTFTAAYSFTVMNLPEIPVLEIPVDSLFTDTLETTFTWAPSIGADTYEIMIDNVITFDSGNAIDSVLADTTYVDSLAYGEYFWKVRAINDAGNSDYSDVRMLTIMALPVEIPTLLSPADSSFTDIRVPTFTWSAAEGATSYTLTIDQNDSFTPPAYREFTVADTTYTLDSLDMMMYGTYYWKVKSVNNVGETEYSDPWMFKIMQSPVAPVLTAPADSIYTSSQTPTFEWTEIAGATLYEVYIDDVETFDDPTIDSVTTASFTPETAIPYGAYFWKVRAINQVGNGEFSETWSFTIMALPEIPVLTSPSDASELEDQFPVFVWEAVTGATGYEILIDDTDTFAGVDPFVVTDPTYTVVDALDAATYYWKVRAINEVGAGDYSAVWSFAQTSSIEDSNIPTVTKLRQNYPNPFNPETTVSFDLAENTLVNISVFNYKGELVQTLVNEHKNIGSYNVKWNGNSSNGITVNSGMYFIVMRTDKYSQVVKALMVK